MKLLLKWIALAMPVIMISACKHHISDSSEDAKRTVFFDKSGMDTTISPGDQLFFVRQQQMD